MNRILIGTILSLATATATIAAEVTSYLTFDNQPLGSEQKPLVMRTYLPNLDLDSKVLSNHGTGRKTPRYSAKTGLLSTSSEDQPVPGIPAGIAVNIGKKLSYVWDTTECRLLYAWNNGFLDMESYWGSPDRGSRKKNDYVPRLIGNLFYKAKGSHPLTIDGKPVEKILYKGHRRVNGLPTFSYIADGHQIEAEIQAGKSAQTLLLVYRGPDSLGFQAANTAFEIVSNDKGSLQVLVRPNASGSFTGYKKEVITIKTANAEAGEKLYTSFG